VRSWAVVALAAGVLMLTGCGGGSDARLVTANSIGPVRLGEPRSLVEADLGEGTVVRQSVQRYGDLAGWTVIRVRYPQRHLAVWYASKPGGEPVAVLLATASPTYVTTDSGRIGDSVQQLRGLFNTHCQYGLCFDGLPLRSPVFLIDHGHASAIYVSPRNEYPVRVWAAEA
jgi:hypothetical protein